MKTYQNEYVQVQVDCSVHLLQQRWTGIPDSENFRDASLAILALAKRHQVMRWEIDIQQLRLFNPMDLHWFIEHWLPQSNSGLLQKAKIAIILKDTNQFSKLGTDMLIRASMAVNPNLSCRYFLAGEDSDDWLRSSFK
ncbi:hypothetical protein [Spirosoma sp. KNUC1025]|uniref:hypothetical protein n=1 Tax=Spirosoma sp. KNUC1025 TaxID=2894082 RepID=UPI003862F57E|nr:hypothetical protein LN737_18030 [Spirosoma sp. KNUC1025]